MLQNTVRKNLIECVFPEGQVATVRHGIFGFDAQLPGNAIRCAYRFQRRINSDGPKSRTRCGNTPASPIAANFQQKSATARWKPETRNGIFLEVPHQMLIEAAVGGGDHIPHERVNFTGRYVELRQGRGVSQFRNGQGARALDVRLFDLGDQQNRNVVNHGIAVSLPANQARSISLQAFFVTRTHQ